MSSALLLSGGAFRGAVQLPVLEMLQDIPYDEVHGVSVGSINGVMFAQGQLPKLRNIWDSMTGISQIMGFAPSVANMGIYNLKPLRRLLEEHASLRKLKIPFTAGIVNTYSGLYYSWSSEDMKRDKQLHDSVLASSAIVGIMHAQKVRPGGKEMLAVDGGFRNIFPMPEKGKLFDRIDALGCTPLHRVDVGWRPSKGLSGALSMVGRVLELMQAEVFHRDIEQLKARLAPGGVLNIWAPGEMPGEQFAADKKTIRQRYKLVEEAAKKPALTYTQE